jgi:putative tricarboxylic transport membrane protein
VKINDAAIGAALVVLGVFILWHIQGYPAMSGQRFGPAWFPGIVAAGLAICGAMLVVQGGRSRAPWVAFDAWTGRKRPVAGFAAVILGLGFYVLASEPLGFHLTGFVLLLAWMRILGTRLPLALIVAVVAPIAIHLSFYKLLRIPLPWGALERLAF